MELKLKHEQTKRALSSLLELVLKFKEGSNDSILRDAMVQRFEYTTEAFWKYLKAFLKEEHNFLANSPREVIRTGLQAKLYDEKLSSELLQMFLKSFKMLFFILLILELTIKSNLFILTRIE